MDGPAHQCPPVRPTLTVAERQRAGLAYLACWALVYLIGICVVSELPGCEPAYGPEGRPHGLAAWCTSEQDIGIYAVILFTFGVMPWGVLLGWLIAAVVVKRFEGGGRGRWLAGAAGVTAVLILGGVLVYYALALLG